MARQRDRPHTPGKSLTPPSGVGAGGAYEAPGAQPEDMPSSERAGFETMFASGPLPMPAILAGYKQVTPGLEQEIVRWAASNGEHRREMDREGLAITKENLRKEFRTQWAGMSLGFVLALGVLALAGYALSLGRDMTAVALILGELVALVTAFVYGTKQRQRERESDDDHA
jgi:uncharacterized membrane protein